MKLLDFMRLNRDRVISPSMFNNTSPQRRTTAALVGPEHIYNQDGLRSVHNHEFMDDPAFQSAYLRGVEATRGRDYAWHWRVHVGIWAAQTAVGLKGDFVECGVGRGFLSSAIMHYLDWNRTGRQFYLLDTFTGLDPQSASKKEIAATNFFYEDDLDAAHKNFSEWPNTKIIVGSIPTTLSEIDTKAIAYLHLDMNNRPPEVAALIYLWDRITPGAPILLDDYAYHGYRDQKLGIDEFAGQMGVPVLSLPTGQGLLIKPSQAPSLPR